MENRCPGGVCMGPVVVRRRSCAHFGFARRSLSYHSGSNLPFTHLTSLFPSRHPHGEKSIFCPSSGGCRRYAGTTPSSESAAPPNQRAEA
ncbi:hypothetical protein RSOLAG1IB_05248 [Rhizoctonia solani AG-1 IB]|uniref:Uncharacterized protein n=1 Tax=Thanatephorus cucumeris (strain AG1-IB / isolate 7/3/14) TaxID=1108050 RepID=A0A0B7FZ37_THACB|nr:hypothetical protein RSOLAG1IB_05248 [Rhizoctonia solani AG-1 IB]